MKREIFRFWKDEPVNEDDFIRIESAIRERTEARDELTGEALKSDDDITNQYAKADFEVIIKSVRKRKGGEKR